MLKVAKDYKKTVSNLSRIKESPSYLWSHRAAVLLILSKVRIRSLQSFKNLEKNRIRQSSYFISFEENALLDQKCLKMTSK